MLNLLHKLPVLAISSWRTAER